MLTVCFHGAESTGKSVMAVRLAQRFGWPCVPEYGREYCERHGTDLSMDDLLAITRGHAAATVSMAAARPDVLIVDTDPLMTAAWALMLFGHIPAPLLAYPKADLYLLFEVDVPWIADGTRFFGADDARVRFAAMARDVLVQAGVPYLCIDGTWDAREAQVVAAIETALAR
ncbi:MAG: N-acetylglucosamine-6-phosphate deacetylase [Novosphingobium sp.]|nr:N-acetylglucosamine-6-phosphate deacetylase [Novosphingobium sp.]